MTARGSVKLPYIIHPSRRNLSADIDALQLTGINTVVGSNKKGASGRGMTSHAIIRTCTLDHATFIIFSSPSHGAQISTSSKTRV